MLDMITMFGESGRKRKIKMKKCRYLGTAYEFEIIR